MGFLSGFKQKIVSWVAILVAGGGSAAGVLSVEDMVSTVVLALISICGRQAFDRYIFPVLQALAFLVLHHPDREKVPSALRNFLEGILNAKPPATEPTTITGAK